MKSKKVIAMMVVGLVATLPAATGLMAGPLTGAEDPPVASYVLDQAQEGTHYGFWFDNAIVRWQEFKPFHTSLARIDLYIVRNGKPGNLCVAVRDQGWKVLWEDIVAGVDIGAVGWIEIPVYPSISLQADSSYYICVRSDADSSDPGNRYFWRGQRDSDYDREISSLEDASPGYDFAFRTWSSLPCVDFEDPPLGKEYPVGGTFTDSGAVIDVQIFQLSDGRWYDDGHARVANRGYAGGSGQEMEVINVNLGFDFGGPWEDLSLLFGEYGGNLNIDINGDFRNFNDFIDISKLTIGGVEVVVNDFGADKGSLTLSGIIYSFAIGGQELVIDDVCLTVPAEKPDLIITDVWSEDGIICYQIRNIGRGVALAGHHTGLLIDGVYVIDDYVAVNLAPGERLNRCFDYDWVCTPLEDTVEVCADYQDDVDESDETNNSRQEIWKCDVTPPKIIEGPSVSKMTTSSALVSWDTDEDSDSTVKYDKAAGKYDLEEKDSTLVKNHGITLTGLEPSAVYHFVVQSTDSSGNTVQSKDVAFQTLASPDSEDPVVSIIDPGICTGITRITAVASDNTGVEKVQFYLEDKLMYTDYSSSSPDYEFFLDTLKYPNGTYRVEAIACDLSGRFDTAIQDVEVFNPALDNVSPYVSITRPSEGDTLSETASIEAEASDNAGVERVEFHVDGEYRSCDRTSPYIFSWNTQTVENGEHTITVTAYDFRENSASDSITVIVDNLLPPPAPVIMVTREVERWFKTGYSVSLEVENAGDVAANNIEIVDRVRGFQALPYGKPTYDTTTNECELHLTIPDLPPDSNAMTQYYIVPILFEDATSYAIGTYTHISYEGPEGELYEDDLAIPAMWVDMHPGAWNVARAVDYVVGQADYLIVTNPRRLFDRYVHNDVGVLLSTMSHLAYLKRGVLGYLDTYGLATLQGLIEPGGDWSSRLTDDWPSNGYLLVVGETGIVPSGAIWDRDIRDATAQWTAGPVYPVPLVDNVYADISGSDNLPELIVGRIIGNDAQALRTAIQTSLVDAFERGNAFVVSGLGDGQQSFERNAEDVADILDDVFAVDLMHASSYAGHAARLLQFRNRAKEKDVVYFRDHGSLDAWSSIVRTWDFPVDFGESYPFAFSMACRTGDYDLGSIAEAFLGSNTTVYVGPTEASPRDVNNEAGKKFFTEWVSGYSESLGQALKETKRELGAADDYKRLWLLEYNLYGDPKYKFSDAVIDQAQLGTNYGFAFGGTTIRWQEFKPDHLEVSQIDIYIRKVGYPGNLCVAIKDSAEHILWETAITEANVETGWINIGAVPSVPLIPGNSYYIYVWTDAPSSADNRYSWLGQTDSHYDSGISSVENSWPGYDFAFRTWKRSGEASRGAASAAYPAEKALQEDLSSLDVIVPDYEVTTADGLDYIEIPGGMLLLVEGKPQVPYCAASIDYPRGYKVQDVVLTDRSGLVTTTGLSLPTVSMAPGGDGTQQPEEMAEPASLDWYPEEEYYWQILENPDGTTTLVITMYPFYYNSLTTDVEFYKNYSFDIDYAFSSLEITSLTTDKDAYQQGDTVMVDIGLSNSGAAQHVVVNALIKRYTSGELVDGLLLRSLEGLTGLASFSPQWDSTGFEPDYYYVEVILKNTNGNLLDRRTEMFRLGICSGEITDFSATPEFFDIGDEIDISMAFNNTGTVDITGTAVIRVQDEVGELVQEFGHEFTDLAPSDSVSFDDTWDTSGAEEGTYTIIGYALYDAKATDPATTAVSTSDPPNRPSSPSPANHATGVSIDADLSWSGGDPDAGDTVTYDVYFGTSVTPPFKETIGPYPATQSSTTYDPGTLVEGTTYYWQIVATDNHGITREGPVWEFTVEIEEIQLSLRAGWNMVSVPLTLADNSTDAVFASVAGVFTWNATATSREYYEPTVIEPEKGYWVAVTEDTTITVNGTPVDTWTTDIKAGWNMIGSVNMTMSIADPNDNPDGSVIPPAYWWDPESKSYVVTTDVEPGKGYWTASVDDCMLTL